MKGTKAEMKTKKEDSALFKIEAHAIDHQTKSPTVIKIRHDFCWQKVLCACKPLGKLKSDSKEEDFFWTVEYLPGPNGEKSLSPFKLKSLSENKYLIMDDNGQLALTDEQPVDYWSWQHAKFVWNGEKLL